MAINLLQPKPQRWLHAPGLVNPNWQWVWSARPRLILPMWEHASAGAAQRYSRTPQSRGGRTWQLNTGAAATRTPWGPGVAIPTTNGAEIEPTNVLPNNIGWGANEPYTMAFVMKRISGGASTQHIYRSNSSSTGDHIGFFTSGVTPNLRHDGTGTVTITSSVNVVNDTTWFTLVYTWQPNFLGLYLDGILRASSTAAATATSDAFNIYRWGWGFSTSQDFNGEVALVACFASAWTAAMVRRWHADPFGFLRPWSEVPALISSPPPPPAPGTGRPILVVISS